MKIIIIGLVMLVFAEMMLGPFFGGLYDSTGNALYLYITIALIVLSIITTLGIAIYYRRLK